MLVVRRPHERAAGNRPIERACVRIGVEVRVPRRATPNRTPARCVFSMRGVDTSDLAGLQ